MSHVHHTASVAATALVTGDVTIGAGSRVLSGAVLNGDLGPVRLGEDVVVMEHALLRGRPDHPVEIGDAVLVGPHTHLNGTTVEDAVQVPRGPCTIEQSEHRAVLRWTEDGQDRCGSMAIEDYRDRLADGSLRRGERSDSEGATK